MPPRAPCSFFPHPCVNKAAHKKNVLGRAERERSLDRNLQVLEFFFVFFLPGTRALGASVAEVVLLWLLERRPREALLLLLLERHLLVLLLLKRHLLLLRLLVVVELRPRLPLLSLRPREERPRLLLLLLLRETLRLLLLLLRETLRLLLLLLRETTVLLLPPGEQRRGDVRRHWPLLIALLLLLKLLLRAELRARAPLLLIHRRRRRRRRLSPSAAPACVVHAATTVPERRHGLPQIRQRRRRGPPVEQPPGEPGHGPRRGSCVAEAQQRGPPGAARGPVGVKVRRAHELPKLPRGAFDLGVRGPPVQRGEEDGGPGERGRWERGRGRARGGRRCCCCRRRRWRVLLRQQQGCCPCSFRRCRRCSRSYSSSSSTTSANCSQSVCRGPRGPQPGAEPALRDVGVEVVFVVVFVSRPAAVAVVDVVVCIFFFFDWFVLDSHYQ